MAKEAIVSGRAPSMANAARKDPAFNAKAVYDLAIQGDEEAKEVFARVGRALGIAIANLVNAFNLPMYVVGGGAASGWDAFSPFIFEELQSRSLVYAATAPNARVSGGRGAKGRSEPDGGTKTIVTRALIGSDAGLLGAARLPMTSGN
jgi:glucokinase